MATRIIPHYAAFTDYTPVIPKLYWGVESQEQRILAICKELGKVIAYVDEFADVAEDTQTSVNELEALFKEFQESGFDDYYLQQIETWVNENMPLIMSKAVKTVYFGLTLEGYFAAYIPDSWNDVIFDTGAIFGTEQYGRLILRMDVDSPYTVEQPSTNLSDDQISSITESISALNYNVDRLNRTAYTPISSNDVIG